MKSTKVLLWFVFLVLVVGSIAPLSAQGTSGTGYVPYGCIKARKGDGFWRITKRELSTTEWIGLYKLNPKTQDGKKRKFTTDPETGWPYVYVGNGELICGFDKLGFVPEMATFEELQGMGLVKTVTELPGGKNAWLWLLLFAISMIMFWHILGQITKMVANFYLRRDPTRVGSGRVNEDGIKTPMEAVAHFDKQFRREYPAIPNLPIIRLVRGVGYGSVAVSDSNSTYHNRILDGQEVWQVTVRMPDGHEEVRYSLLACANDVRAGGGFFAGENFRFVPLQDVTNEIRPVATAPTQPEPAPAVPVAQAAQTAPAPEPLPVPTPVISDNGEFVRTKDAPEVVEDGWVTFEFRRSTKDKPNMIRLNGIVAEEMTFSTRGRETFLRYTEVVSDAETVGASK